MTDHANLLAEIDLLGEKLAQAKASITRQFIGQEDSVELALATLLCGGHALLVGLPGLGKTKLVETFAAVCRETLLRQHSARQYFVDSPRKIISDAGCP